MDIEEANNISQAGTGFMVSLTDIIYHLEKKGYTANLVPRFDHFECGNGAVRLFPEDFLVDEMKRYENTSDPDDQAIVYAIHAIKNQVKGVYVDSYGLYHDELS